MSEYARDADMSVARAVVILWKHRWIVIGSALLFALSAGVLALVSKPLYRAQVVFASAGAAPQSQLASLVGKLGGLGAFDSLGTSAPSAAENLAFIESEEFISAFIAENNLLPELFAPRWDAQNNRWRIDEKQPTVQDGYRRFVSKIMSMKLDKDTALVTVSVDWGDPKQAAEWANTLVVRANQILRARALEQSSRSVQYLQTELERTARLEIQQSIYRLIETQLNAAMFASARDDYAFRMVSPAIPPDPHRIVSPKRVRMVALGLIAGILLSSLLILALRSDPRDSSVLAS